MIGLLEAFARQRAVERQAEENRRTASQYRDIQRLEEIQAVSGRGEWTKSLHPMTNVARRLYRTSDGQVFRFDGFRNSIDIEWFVPDEIRYFPSLQRHMTVIDRKTTIPEVKR